MTPLVCVHGFMGGSDQWRLQAPLAESRELICLDLPGFGKNAHLPPIDSIATFASWALEEVSRRGVSQFDLMGHSMGGMIVQDMIRQAPDRIRNLILYGTGATGVLPGRFETIETSMQRATSEGAAATADRISATWFRDGVEAAEYPACAAIARQATLAAIMAGLAAMQGWRGEENLKDITASTLVVWGDGDRTYPWSQTEKLWHGIKTCNLAVLPNCAHAVHLENPAVFNTIVDEFLSG